MGIKQFSRLPPSDTVGKDGNFMEVSQNKSGQSKIGKDFGTVRKQFCWFRTFANSRTLSPKLANYHLPPGLLWHHLCTLKRSITPLSGKLPSHDVVTVPAYFPSKVRNPIVRMSVSIVIGKRQWFWGLPVQGLWRRQNILQKAEL